MNSGGMTVKQVASRIARTPEEVPAVIGQLRHWTKVGLLKPEGGTFTSTGHWRRYSEHEMHIAVVIVALSRMGWTVGPLADAVLMLRTQLTIPPRSPEMTAWRDAIKGRRRVLALFTIILPLRSNHSGFCIIDPDTPSIPEDWPAGVWLDLTAIFSRVRE